MQRVRPQQTVILVRQLSHFFGQCVVAFPEIWRREVVHNSRQHKAEIDSQRPAQPGLPLLSHPLPECVKAARLNVLHDLTIPCVRPIFFNPVQKICQFFLREFNNCCLDFFNAHVQIIPSSRLLPRTRQCGAAQRHRAPATPALHSQTMTQSKPGGRRPVQCIVGPQIE